MYCSNTTAPRMDFLDQSLYLFAELDHVDADADADVETQTNTR
jgi:hypothetical protein